MGMVCAGDLYPIDVGQEPAVTSPQPEDDYLPCPGEVCDVIFSVVVQAVLLDGVAAAVYDGPGRCGVN